MHYILFVGIFGIPIVACVGMLATKFMDTFTPERTPEPDHLDKSRLQAIESRVNDLVDTFVTTPVEPSPKQ